MVRQRPTPVLVIAILHFTFGGMSLFWGLCGIGMQVGMHFAQANNLIPKPPPGPPGSPQPMTQADIQKFQEERIPYFRETTYGNMGYDLVLSSLMVIAGFGLLRMRSWGRSLSIAYAGLSIAHKIVMMFYAFIFVFPVMDELVPEMLSRMGPQPPFLGNMMTFFMKMVPVMQLSSLIYPIAVLVIMYLPSVSAAFRGETAAGTERVDALAG
jgi:hypothetical protein